MQAFALDKLKRKLKDTDEQVDTPKVGSEPTGLESLGELPPKVGSKPSGATKRRHEREEAHTTRRPKPVKIDTQETNLEEHFDVEK